MDNGSQDTAPQDDPSGLRAWQKTGEIGFQVFCAVIFLGMIGLVFINALLRYLFGASFPPSEEWARFLFLYITFFGAIEAFYRNRHIAVDMVVSKLRGTTRKAVDIVASLLTMFSLGLLLVGGVQLVRQTMDTNSVATNINMTYINGILPLMALATLIIHFRQFLVLLRSREGRRDLERGE